MEEVMDIEEEVRMLLRKITLERSLESRRQNGIIQKLERQGQEYRSQTHIIPMASTEESHKESANHKGLEMKLQINPSKLDLTSCGQQSIVSLGLCSTGTLTRRLGSIYSKRRTINHHLIKIRERHTGLSSIKRMRLLAVNPKHRWIIYGEKSNVKQNSTPHPQI